MNRKWIVVLCLNGAVALGSAGLLAKDKLEGKQLYQEYCRPCHGPDSPHGEYSPMALIQEQWEEFFSQTLVSSHADVESPKDKSRKLLDELDAAHLQALKAWAVDHAADSEQPMSCDVKQ